MFSNRRIGRKIRFMINILVQQNQINLVVRIHYVRKIAKVAIKAFNCFIEAFKISV